MTTKFGRWFDHYCDLSLREFSEISGVSRPTLSKLYSDPDYHPSDLTQRNVIVALQREGYNVRIGYFW